ncbi:MAG: hypothetical protein KC586_17410 [Myxococcales bacterium]|nr:hypothetical protein [Myxococcales bacterium]
MPAWLLGAWEVDAAAVPPERRAKLVGGRLDVRPEAFELYDFPETIFDRRWPLEACLVRGEVVELRADVGCTATHAFAWGR